MAINRNAPFDSLNIEILSSLQLLGKTAEGIYKNTHRISGIETYDDLVTITTKGDANPLPIELIDYPVKENNYIGKVVFTMPKLGYGKII